MLIVLIGERHSGVQSEARVVGLHFRDAFSTESPREIQTPVDRIGALKGVLTVAH